MQLYYGDIIKLIGIVSVIRGHMSISMIGANTHMLTDTNVTDKGMNCGVGQLRIRRFENWFLLKNTKVYISLQPIGTKLLEELFTRFAV